MSRQAGAPRGLTYIAGACAMSLLAALPARADEDALHAAPRTSLNVGGASVVLAAANDRLYAYVDRLADNTPATDALLSIDVADGPSLSLTRVADGQFVAPYTHTGRSQDAFTVSVASAEGNGDGSAQIIYEDVGPAELPPARLDIRVNAAIALVAGALGLALGVSMMLIARSRRRRATASGTSALGAG